jgi:Tfp pilus assembly protein PilO
VAKALSARERRFLVAGVAAVVLFFGARLLLGRAMDFVTRVNKLLPEKVKVLAAYREAVGREAALEHEAESLDAELKSYDPALLPGATPALAAAVLQTRLKELADRAGLKIQSEKILPHVKKETYLEVPVQVVASGDVRNLRDFTVAVESSPVFIAVQEMTLRTVKRRQFVPETRNYVDVNDIQASMTLVGLIPG